MEGEFSCGEVDGGENGEGGARGLLCSGGGGKEGEGVGMEGENDVPRGNNASVNGMHCGNGNSTSVQGTPDLAHGKEELAHGCNTLPHTGITVTHCHTLPHAATRGINLVHGKSELAHRLASAVAASFAIGEEDGGNVGKSSARGGWDRGEVRRVAQDVVGVEVKLKSPDVENVSASRAHRTRLCALSFEVCCSVLQRVAVY